MCVIPPGGPISRNRIISLRDSIKFYGDTNSLANKRHSRLNSSVFVGLSKCENASFCFALRFVLFDFDRFAHSPCISCLFIFLYNNRIRMHCLPFQEPAQQDRLARLRHKLDQQQSKLNRLRLLRSQTDQSRVNNATLSKSFETFPLYFALPRVSQKDKNFSLNSKDRKKRFIEKKMPNKIEIKHKIEKTRFFFTNISFFRYI